MNSSNCNLQQGVIIPAGHHGQINLTKQLADYHVAYPSKWMQPFFSPIEMDSSNCNFQGVIIPAGHNGQTK